MMHPPPCFKAGEVTRLLFALQLCCAYFLVHTNLTPNIVFLTILLQKPTLGRVATVQILNNHTATPLTWHHPSLGRHTTYSPIG